VLAKEAGYDFVELGIDASEERISRVYTTYAERRTLFDLSRECDPLWHTERQCADKTFSGE